MNYTDGDDSSDGGSEGDTLGNPGDCVVSQVTPVFRGTFSGERKFADAIFFQAQAVIEVNCFSWVLGRSFLNM